MTAGDLFWSLISNGAKFQERKSLTKNTFMNCTFKFGEKKHVSFNYLVNNSVGKVFNIYARYFLTKFLHLNVHCLTLTPNHTLTTRKTLKSA